MSQARQVTTRSVVFTLAMLLQTGVSFVLIPVYTAHLTPADYGILSIAASVGGILTILYLQSMEGVFTRFYYDFTDEQQRRPFLGSIWLFHLAFAVVLTVTFFIIGRSQALLALVPIPHDPFLRYVILTTFVSTIAFILPRSLFLVREQKWRYAALNLGLFVLSTTLVIYFVAVKGEGAAGSLKGVFYATLLVAVPGILTVLRNIRPAWRAHQIREGLAFALPLVPHLLALWAIDLADRLILRHYVPLAEVGIYTLGYQIGSVPQIVAFAVATAITPFYFKTAESRDDAPEVLGRLASNYVALIAWASVATVALGPGVIALIAAEPGYRESHRVIPWVAAGSFMRAFYFIFVAAIYYRKQVTVLPVVTAVAAVVNIALNLLLIPRAGYMGAAVMTFVTFSFQATLMYVFARRAFPLPYEWRRIALIASAALVWGALLSRIDLSNLLLDLLLKASLSLAFPVMLWASSVIRWKEL